MKIWITREDEKRIGCGALYLWKEKPEPHCGYYHNTLNEHESIGKLTAKWYDFTSILGFNPKHGSCFQIDLAALRFSI